MAANMDKDEVKTAMAEAGLIAPKVLPMRLRDGRMVFDLWAGPPGLRRTQRVSTDAAPEQIDAAIAALQHPE